MSVASYIPPLAVSRMIGTYHFEGGGYVAIVADGQVSAELIIEKAQALLDLTREELAASGIETEGHDPAEGHGAEHESPAPKGGAHA